MKAVEAESESKYTSAPSLSENQKNEPFFTPRSASNFFFREGAIQPKLEIGRPDDEYEQEADHVADAVMRMPDPQVQRQPMEEEEEEKLHKKSDGKAPSANHASSEISSQLSSRSGRGNRLPNAVQSEMGTKIGADFSGVNIHTDATSHKLNRQLGAKAFTHGSDIYFNEGEYNLTTSSGKHLLAHELAHVVQDIGDRIQKNGNGDVTTEEFDLSEQKKDYHKIVKEWYDRYSDALSTNKTRARHANDRFIEFEEGGISELQTLGSVTGGAIALFGGPAAVAGLCVTVLTNVAGQNLSGKSQKKAASVARLEEKLAEAEETLDNRRENLDNRIDNMTSAYDHRGWISINNQVRSYGVPEIASENILYRDLLLAFARGGDYNISGSQWNVENRSIFGDAPWYHTSDWGSPGWTNGQDIAEELNNLAEADPSTRKEVHIN